MFSFNSVPVDHVVDARNLAIISLKFKVLEAECLIYLDRIDVRMNYLLPFRILIEIELILNFGI